MKKKIIRSAACSGILIMLAACNSKEKENAVAVIDKEKVKKEIQSRENEFAAIYNKGKVIDIDYYADDSKSFYQNTAPLVGREAIIEFLKSASASNSNRISFNTNEVFVSVDGEQVLEVGSFKLVDSSNAIIDNGNYMSLFVKRNGKYVCVRDMSTSDYNSEKK
ncbi:nuclear transport factor 2 family protein [Flavobacterium sp. LPB0248]|uniref:YybH family protein n=1 Tax=Flavobacterium sp. LPB0248 TaxID=2614441 RepID=UPI0015A723BE|nr:nuclear transport factor 2 family protein [Flavobacterium sp. LPB0248]QLC64754.1 nuclear transport factor 2 family protein [Flavobacterium sp. LPB0248]